MFAFGFTPIWATWAHMCLAHPGPSGRNTEITRLKNIQGDVPKVLLTLYFINPTERGDLLTRYFMNPIERGYLLIRLLRLTFWQRFYIRKNYLTNET